MRISLHRIVLLGLAISIATAQPVNSLFGSECKKPKASYENYLKQIKKLEVKVSKDNAAKSYELRKVLNLCKTDFKAFTSALTKSEKQLIKSKKDCFEASPLFDKYRILKDWPQWRQTIKDSYQVILNNQKCFSPELVIEAQRKLGVIK